MGQTDEPTVDPDALTDAQRTGDACVVCRKKWPRPRIRVGRLPDASGVFACDDCAPAPPAPRTARGPREPAAAARTPAPMWTTEHEPAVMEVSPGRG
nr:hypothetical protein [Actinomadura macra]